MGSIFQGLVNPLQPFEPARVATRYGLRRTFVRELRARQDVGTSEPTGGGHGEQGQQRGARMTAQ
jgi:hypothetical protein